MRQQCPAQVPTEQPVELIPLSVTRYPRYCSLQTGSRSRTSVNALARCRVKFKKPWLTTTPNLSPKWIAAFLERSAYVPKYVNFDVAPYPLLPRLVRKPPPMAFLSEVVEEVFSHASRIEDLYLEGDTVDVIRTLTSLDRSTALLFCLSLGTFGESNYPRFDSWDDLMTTNAKILRGPLLSDTHFSGSAPRLRRLHFLSELEVSFPSILSPPLSCSFCVKRLFSALGVLTRPLSSRCREYRPWDGNGSCLPLTV